MFAKLDGWDRLFVVAFILWSAGLITFYFAQASSIDERIRSESAISSERRVANCIERGMKQRSGEIGCFEYDGVKKEMNVDHACIAKAPETVRNSCWKTDDAQREFWRDSSENSIAAEQDSLLKRLAMLGMGLPVLLYVFAQAIGWVRRGFARGGVR